MIASQHPGPEELDTLLDPGGDQRVHDHVAGCPSCQGVVAELRDIRALLRRHAAPVPPIPAEVSARIFATLAAEPPLTGLGAGSFHDGCPDFSALAGAGGADDRREPAPPPARRRTQRMFALAAGFAVLAGGGALMVSQLTPTATTSAAEQAVPDPTLAPSEPEMAQGLMPQTDPAQGGGASDTFGAASVYGATGTAYTSADLASQVSQVLASRQAMSRSPDVDGPAASTRSPTTVARAADGQALGDCLQALGIPTEPVLVDQATFDGTAATIIVVQATPTTGSESGSGQSLDVYAVDPGCARGVAGEGFLHVSHVG